MWPTVNFVDPIPYIEKLGPKYVKLFQESIKADHRIMVGRMLIPMSHTGSTYIGLDDIVKRTSRSDFRTKHVPSNPHTIKHLTYFTNAMSVGETPPSSRATLGKYVCFTYEYDKDDIDFFKRQLDWCLPTLKPEQSAIGKLHKSMSRYSDFVGITVVWGGNKSLHVHVVFDTTAYTSSHPVPLSPYSGLGVLWDKIEEDVRRILRPPSDVPVDKSLRSCIAYRRTPGSVRYLDTKQNILGMPIGSQVEQLVLWEQWRDRAGRGAVRALFNPSVFTIHARSIAANATGSLTKSQTFGGTLTTDEISHAEERMRVFYPDWPRFDHFEYERSSDSYRALFRNSEADKNPSSVMKSEFNAIHVGGSDPDDVVKNARKLPAALGTMLMLWAKQYHSQSSSKCEASLGDSRDDCDDFIWPSHRRTSARLQATFNSTTTLGALRKVTQDAAGALLDGEKVSMLRAAEGVGKTTALLQRHPLSMQDKSGLAMYAFTDYANAQEKCDAFNRLKYADYVGVIWKSFGRAYSDACAELGIGQLSMDDVVASTGKVRSLWQLIELRQPEIIQLFKRDHAAIWKAVGGKNLVIFTVHAVAHRWRYMSRTRTMWHRDIWDSPADETLEAETKLSILVHDECSPDTFIYAVTAEQHVWLRRYRQRLYDLVSKGRLTEALKTFKKYLDPFPGGALFYDVLGNISVPITSWNAVTTQDTLEFFIPECNDPKKDIYGRAHQCDWAIADRGWWDGVAEHILFLTTEFTSMAVAKAAIPALDVLDIDPPEIPRDEVDLVCRRVVSDNLQEFADEIHRDVGADVVVVTNTAKGPSIISHAAAKGRNNLAESDIAHVVTWMSPGQYEKLQALNAYAKRSDLVLRSVTDAMNQTCGRNRGMRNVNHHAHCIYMPHRLYDTLVAHDALAWLRYDLVIIEDAATRKYARR